MTCTICNEPATGQYKIDLDVPGIGFCEAHEKDVHLLFIMVGTMPYEEFEKRLKYLQKKNGKMGRVRTRKSNKKAQQ